MVNQHVNNQAGVKPPRSLAKTLVLGANGFIGAALVPALVKKGCSVRASGRDLNALKRHQWRGVELVQCDLLRPETLAQALEGIEQIFYLVHSMNEGAGFFERELRSAKNLAIEAAKLNISHIIYLGSLVVSGSESEHFRARVETGKELRSTGLTVTEVRSPIVIGAGSAPFEVFRDIVNHLPFIIVSKQLHFRSAPVALDDLIFYLSNLLDSDDLWGEQLEISGPEQISYIDIMSRYAAFINKKFDIYTFPKLPIWLIRFFIPMLSTAPKKVIQALLSGLHQDIIAKCSRLQINRPRKLLTIEQAFQAVIEKERKQHDSIDWYQGNMIYRLHNNQNSFYGEKIHTRHKATTTAKNVWLELTKLGGQHGYYFLDSVWRIRGLIDSALGGPGMVRFRDNADELYSGERIDTWIIIEAQRDHRLLLQFMMRSPGAGCLEFVIEQQQQQCVLSINAYFHPKGLWGRAYWLLLKPAHLLLFHGMSKKILRLAALSSK